MESKDASLSQSTALFTYVLNDISALVSDIVDSTDDKKIGGSALKRKGKVFC